MSNVSKKGDIFRVVNGYDDCGFVCGRVTPMGGDIPASCKGLNSNDKTKLPWVRFGTFYSICNCCEAHTNTHKLIKVKID